MIRRVETLSAWLLRLGAGGLVIGALGSMTSTELLRGLGAGIVLIGTGFGCAFALFTDRLVGPEQPGTEGTR
jgi:hypothetical protein